VQALPFACFCTEAKGVHLHPWPLIFLVLAPDS
jgi:hypothetical protein